MRSSARGELGSVSSSRASPFATASSGRRVSASTSARAARAWPASTLTSQRACASTTSAGKRSSSRACPISMSVFAPSANTASSHPSGPNHELAPPSMCRTNHLVASSSHASSARSVSESVDCRTSSSSRSPTEPDAQLASPACAARSRRSARIEVTERPRASSRTSASFSGVACRAHSSAMLQPMRPDSSASRNKGSPSRRAESRRDSAAHAPLRDARSRA